MGTFNQTGGTNLASGLFGVADNNASMGVFYGGGKGFYNLSGGYLSTVQTPGYAHYENIGLNGNGQTTSAYTETGIFTQTGGTNNAGTVSLGSGSNSKGTYYLGNGLLQAYAIDVNNGVSAFSFTGGTLQAQAWPSGGATDFSGVPLTIAATSAAALDMNGNHVNLQSLVVNSNLVDLNFADPTTGNDLLSVGGLTVNDPTAISFGTNPLATGGPYELIAGAGVFTPAQLLADFTLPTVPGVTYSLTQTSGNIYLSVAAVPEPGTLALLGAGLMSLLAFARRRRKAV